MERLSPQANDYGRRLAAVVVLALLLAGCSFGPPTVDDPGEAVGDTPAVAADMVRTWLDRASNGTDDLGWGLIYPNTRTDLFKSEDVYRAAVLGADWSSFSYEILEVVTEDGEYRVRLRLAGAPGFTDDWGLIQFPSDDGDPPPRSLDGATVLANEGMVGVRIAPSSGPRGIQAVG